MWIPPLSRGVGTVILAIAFFDHLVLELTGRRGGTAPTEALRNE